MTSTFEEDELQLDATRQVLDTWESILLSQVRALRSSSQPGAEEVDNLQQQLYATARERRALRAGDPAVATANERYSALIAAYHATKGG